MAANQNVVVKGAPLDLTVTRGADFGPVTVHLTDDADAPIDLTGAMIIARYQRNHKQGAIANFGTDIPAPQTDGKFVFALLAAVTAGMVAGDDQYDWNLWISRGGIVTPLYTGKISVLEQVE